MYPVSTAQKGTRYSKTVFIVKDTLWNTRDEKNLLYVTNIFQLSYVQHEVS